MSTEHVDYGNYTEKRERMEDLNLKSLYMNEIHMICVTAKPCFECEHHNCNSCSFCVREWKRGITETSSGDL